MTAWTLWEYSEVISSFLNGLDRELQGKVTQKLHRLSTEGTSSRRPQTAPLGNSLFELLCRSGRVRLRLLFYFGSDRRVVFVHAIDKKCSSVPQEDLAIARKRRRLAIEDERRLRALTYPN